MRAREREGARWNIPWCRAAQCAPVCRTECGNMTGHQYTREAQQTHLKA